MNGTGGKILNRGVFGTYAETFPFLPVAQLDAGDIANDYLGNKASVLASDVVAALADAITGVEQSS